MDLFAVFVLSPFLVISIRATPLHTTYNVFNKRLFSGRNSVIRLRSSQLPVARIVRYRIDDSRVVSNHTVYGDPEKAAVYTF
jgi:hypothetical protein